ncbi:hydantoinase/oxoprolinase family protein [Hyphomicrobium sp.]|uniref:hydantoinase/oxoprolinase family protein n=1 Tax=Hyphomicrobium sp. TaxID=82 RepID=UPI002D76CB1F|nr:hydantoinase/oxoprolinase family protein [Hyphomicrobium sp.]HET6387895.1 hydantoinase/oxoprolinase family protein [Hyphomicrobium sp.]
MTNVTIGLDVGGAHLKVARVEDGRVVAVRQIACPLWEGLDRLDRALREAEALLANHTVCAVTMTGELTEIFDSRESGVLALIERLRERLTGELRIFMGLKGFASPQAARGDPLSVASANFIATALLIARRQPKSLLIDMGSTTTDIIACDRPLGLTDAERLQTGELVYTGLTRTSVASIANRAPLAGQWQGLARDGFATMADVRRILGDLPDDVDQHPTADGRGKSQEESLVRFARGFGRDAEMRHLPAWQVSAAYVSERQLRSIHDGALQVLSRPAEDVNAVVLAGIGADYAEQIAMRLGLPAITFGALVDAHDDARLWATRCAPAVAVALLAHK